jgi:hypothetical protein
MEVVYTEPGQSRTQQCRDAMTAIHVPQKEKNHMHVSKLLVETKNPAHWTTHAKKKT